jgi:hypothetical protein
MAGEKQNQIAEEEDDFTFDIGKKPGDDDSGADDGKKDEGKEDDDEGKKDSEKKDDKGDDDSLGEDKKDSGKAEDQKSDKVDNKDLGDEGDKGKVDEGKKDQGKKDEGKKNEFVDIFADEEVKDDKKDTGVKTSYKPIASDLGIELENDTPEEFKTKVTKKIEDAKQEFKLDEYPEDAKAVIKHLKENNGKIEDFLNNREIISLQGVRNLEPEQKVLFVRTNELTNAGVDPQKAQEQAATEIEEYSTKELRDKANSIDAEADKLISAEIKKITGDRAQQVEKEKAKVLDRTKAEINQLKTYVNSQTEFLGIELTEKAKQGILRDIETGAFDDIANKSPESSKFTAYMMSKFGKNIHETLNKKGSEQNRKGYNAALDKSLDALHKTKESAQQKQTGHQKSKAGESGKFDGFSGALGEDE